MKQINIIVHGKVQGVLFRKNTKIIADKLGVTGRVWNNLDSTVEIIAQGNQENLDKLLIWVEKGEGLAHVENISYEYQPITEIYDDFEVLRLR